jgi:serine protease Do
VMRRCTMTALLLLFIAPASMVARAADDLHDREERAIKAAVARVAPAVVRIETVGGLERVGQMLLGTGPTTGLAVAEDGYVISSAFNFVQKPASILVTLADGSRHAARVVATDHSRMLVLLKVDTDVKLSVPEAVPPAEMRVGAWAMAVGRTFEPDQPNVSVGIVSALARIWGKVVQTDAKVSPNNYGGPLVDISGRVFGVLVPMSPDATGEMAGVEWYDSGIGFAVPLADIMHVLPKLREGRDLRPGILGVGIKGADLYGPATVIGTVRGTTPAFKAGIRAGDTIVEAAGHRITRPAQLKQQVGPLYAGDSIKLVATRGDQRLERDVELVDKIEPYVFPFLGVLPLRPAKGEKSDGVIIRFVYPDSPAAAAGLKPGDRIASFNGVAVEDLGALNQLLTATTAAESVRLEVRRGSATLLVEPTLASLPEAIPPELPPAHGELPPAVDAIPHVGLIKLKVPELPSECLAYVPANYDPRLPPGVIVWLHRPRGDVEAELVARWKSLCDRYGFMLLAPKAGDKEGWRPADARAARRFLDELLKTYPADPARVAVHGHEDGGVLSFVMGFANVELVRGVAVVDAPLPRQLQPPDTDPSNRLAIYVARSAGVESAPAIEAGIKRLREQKYPLTLKDIADKGRNLNGEELDELVRWFDTLDRF